MCGESDAFTFTLTFTSQQSKKKRRRGRAHTYREDWKRKDKTLGVYRADDRQKQEPANRKGKGEERTVKWGAEDKKGHTRSARRCSFTARDLGRESAAE